MDAEPSTVQAEEHKLQGSETDIPASYNDVKKWNEPGSDDDEGHVTEYNVANAWKTLFNLPSCQQVMLTDRIQKRLKLIVGLNVTQEFPWKEIKYQELRDNLFGTIPGGKKYLVALRNYDPQHHMLIGYAPLLTQNQDEPPVGDPFIFYLNPDDAKTALAIIRNIELYERWQLTKRLIKKPRRWVSLGSENEINLTLQQRWGDPGEIEIQSVYPLTIPANKEFSFRKAGDVRDGYIELLPKEGQKIESITRRRVTVAIQSGPQLVELAQQTDPTFPTNAWAQYFYEINEEDEALEKSADEEEGNDEKQHKRQSKPPTPAPGEPPAEEIEAKARPEVSDRVKLLLETLDFNQIDMYRNDYSLIYDKQISHFTNPYLEETLCFANISKSYQRYVCGFDWYPQLSGLLVTSYTFSTPATVTPVSQKIDTIQRAVLQANPILMWSFSDNLNYKLEFDSPMEVTALSFCPHDANLLFGGARNGQVVIWDLQNRAEKLDYEEILTAAQSKYRFIISDFLSWTIQINEDSLVPPALVTSLEVSQKAAVTGIYWLGKNFYMNTYGKIYSDYGRKVANKFFATCSIDGTISFWDIESVSEKKVTGAVRDQPKALTQNESFYKGKILKPIFAIAFYEPITSIIADTSVYSCLVVDKDRKRKNDFNFRTQLIAKTPHDMRQAAIVSTFYGRLERIQWLGLYTDADGKEAIHSSDHFARVHDGPIVAMSKNPFYPDIFISIGRNVFALWKEDYNYSPIFWRKRSCDITAIAWSEDRPSVFFLTRIDGNLEAWDILARDDDACFNDMLGGGIVTAISEHRPSEPEKLLGIGDYNSSFRMIKLPKSFYIPEQNELTRLQAYIFKEMQRKQSIQAWERLYFEGNRDVVEAKRQAEIDAHKEMERIEREEFLKGARKANEQAEQAEDQQSQAHLTYSERMERKWYDLNLNRLLGILMVRKRVDEEKLERETQLEKQHIAYEAAKRASFVSIQQRVSEEVAAVRARILPAEKVDLQRTDMIFDAMTDLMRNVEDYSVIEDDANDTVKQFTSFTTMGFLELLHRGSHLRSVLNKSLGGNTQRRFWYECMLSEFLLEDADWGYEWFLNADDEMEGTSVDTHYLRPMTKNEASEEGMSVGAENPDDEEQDKQEGTIEA